MKRLALFAAFASSLALATTLIAVDVPTLSQSADAIVLGTVLSSAPRLTRDGSRIITDTEIQVAEVLKGTPEKTIVVMQPGGIVGDLGQRVEGTAPFTVGEEVVVFLERRGTDRWAVTGMIQGKFHIQRSTGGAPDYAIPAGATSPELVDPATHTQAPSRLSTMPLNDLKAKIAAALAAPATVDPGKAPIRITK